MSNRRIIWLTILLIFCFVGGGLYYAFFSARLPFNISCLEEDKVTQLRFLACRGLIASRLAQFAEQKGKDVSKWDRVKVYYSSGTWNCYVYQEKDKASLEWCVEIAENGKTQEDSLWNSLVKNRQEIKRQLKLEFERESERFSEWFHDNVGFLIQPTPIW